VRVPNRKSAVPDGTWAAGSFYHDVGGSILYLKTINGVSPNSTSVYTQTTGAVSFNTIGATVQNLTIYGLSSSSCIAVAASVEAKILNNTMKWCAVTAIAVTAASNRLVITGNDISESGNGISYTSVDTANNSNNTVVTGNVIHDLDQSRVYDAFTSDNIAILIQGGDDNLFSLNTISHLAGSCVKLYTFAGQSLKRTTVSSNTCEDISNLNPSLPTNQMVGILNGSTNAAHVANDVVDNVVTGNFLKDITGTCFWAKSSQPTVGQPYTWTNNTAVNCSTGLLMEDSENGNIGFVFKNNILVNATINIDHTQNGSDSLVNIHLDYNRYYPDGASSFEWNGTKSAFAAWKTNSSQDTNSSITNPSLTSTYRTPANSSLRRAGESGVVCKDVRGRACYPDHPDIGAYQATSGDPASTRTAR
jgi:hypothetical protein